MNELNKLKLMTYDSAGIAVDPKTRRRSKLAARISEQMAAAKAASEGVVYARSASDKQRKLKHWFRALDDKRWAVMLFYGSKQLELAKGRNAVECAGLTGVQSVLETLRTAVIAGELDTQIGAAAELLKRGFKKA